MANYNWRVGSGAFDVAADWINTTTGQNPATTPPGAGDTANLNATGGTVTGSGNVATLNFAAGPTWTVAGQLSAGNINVNDSASIASGGVLNLSPGAGFAFIANANGATGNLTVNTGAHLTSTIAPQTANYILYVGGGSSVTGANGTLTATGPGALIDMNDNGAAVGLVAGNTGTLNVLNGAIARFGTIDPNGTASLSVGRGGQATVNVSGPGSQLQLAGVMYTGRATGSQGIINVTNGGSLVETAVGTGNTNAIGGSGTINGSFANGGNGQLNVTGGSSANLADIVAIGSNGSTGSATVSGASTLTLGNIVRVGTGTTAPGANGTLTINTGSQVRDTAAADTSTAYLSVGGSANTTGTVTVDGAGSLLDIGSNAIGIGNGGNGSITVSGGASLRSATANSQLQSALGSGNNAGSHGTLTITGAGSSASINGYTYFGRAGTGSLVVSQGGSFTGGSAAVGSTQAFSVTIGDGTPNLDANGNPNSPLNFGGSGTAQVTGGSALHSLGSLRVGYRGTTGSLLVDGGSIALADGQVFAGSGTDRPGGAGTITVQGGSELASGGQHVLSNAGVELGNDAGTSGNINVIGAGSTMTTNGDRLTVGRAGAGILQVSGGGRVLTGAAYADSEAALSLGALAGGAGNVSVQGVGSQLIAAGEAVLGGNNSGAGTAAGGTGTLSVGTGGFLQTGTMVIFGGSSLAVDATSQGVIAGDLADVGTVTTSGAFQVTGNAAGGGTLNLNGGSADLGSLGALTVNMAGGGTVLRTHGLTGAATINGMQFGEAIDLAGVTGATLNGNTVSAGGGAITLGAAPSGYVYKLYGDANGGTDILLNPTSPPPAAISITDASTGQSTSPSGDDYSGPVDYLQRQYIWSGTATDSVAVRANVPNAFLKGGAGDDALQADYGNNVLDGGAGSNFLVGGTGADGGRDTFFLDARDPSQTTWSTIVNFHKGDQATIFGFHPGTSTRPITANDGTPGFTGPTIHSEINGPNTGVNASLTFRGLDPATVQGFTYTTGTLPGNIDYLLIQYT